MHDINRNIGGNTSKQRAKAQRDFMKLYYNDIGAVAWQKQMIYFLCALCVVIQQYVDQVLVSFVPCGQ